jgi:hypothetical protein
MNIGGAARRGHFCAVDEGQRVTTLKMVRYQDIQQRYDVRMDI